MIKFDQLPGIRRSVARVSAPVSGKFNLKINWSVKTP